MRADPRFYESLELFNRRRFFESHEVLERLWLEAKQDPYRDLYKGVIQAAASLFLLERGPQSGAWELSKSAVGHLEKYGPTEFGLNVAKLVKDMRACFNDFRDLEGKRKIPYEESHLPRLEWVEPAA